MKRLMLAAAAAVVLTAATPVLAQSDGLLDKLAKSASSSGAGARVLDRATDLKEYQSAWDGLCGADRKHADRSRAGSADSIAEPVGTWGYDPNRVLCLRLRSLMFTSIFFPRGERVLDAFVGDERTIEVQREEKTGRQILLRPKNDVTGVDTQVTIITQAKTSPKRKIGEAAQSEERVYTFYVRSYPVESKSIPNVTVFVKPKRRSVGMFRSASRSPAPIEAVEVETLDAEPAPMPGRPGTPGANPHEKPDYLREVPFNMNDLRFGEFTIAAKSGSAGIAPERVFHDGRYTILDFGQGVAGDNTPIVDVAEVVDGIDSTVNVQIGGPTGNFIIIESVGDFRLRNGQRVVCITYNGPES